MPVLILVCVFIATGTCLPNCCLAFNGVAYLPKPLCSDDRRDAHVGTPTYGKNL
jgi:hypothetical protein